VPCVKNAMGYRPKNSFSMSCASRMVIFPGVCISSYNPPTAYEPANEPETYNAGTHATSIVEIVMLEKLDCVLSKTTRPYIWSYKCECVRTHLCIDPAE